jgi:putative ABC transport system ATP-binding protein
MIAVTCAVPLFALLKALQKRILAAWDLVRTRVGEMLGTIGESVSGAAVIRAYGVQDRTTDRVSEAIDAHQQAYIRAGSLGAVLFPANEVFAVFTTSAVVVAGLALGPGAGLTAGEMVAFLFLVALFLEPIAEFTEVLDQTQTAVAGLRRVLAVLDMPVGPPTASETVAMPQGQLGIDVRDVTFSYRSRDETGRADAPVLRHIDVSIPAGQDVALVGATGSGKTTLGRLFARFADPTIGEIDIGGVDLRSIDPEEFRRRVVVVAQEPFLFDDTIEANIGFAKPDWDAADVRRVVEELGLVEWVDSLSDGIRTRVGERGESLSAGERQLVGLLRAGYADPDVLILDEATSSVDALTEVRTARALERLAATRTTIAIAHRLSPAARADRVLVLDAGRLDEDGTHRELIGRHGVYRELYESWVAATSV